MANTFVKIAAVTVGAGGASSIDFTSIPQTGYTDLKIVVSARGNNGSDSFTPLSITFNGTTTGYSERLVYGNGENALSATQSASAFTYAWMNGPNSTASTFNNAEMYIPNYTSSNQKSGSIDSVHETNATTAIASLDAAFWANTAAITSIGIAPSAGSFVANSTFYLYGIKNS
jgi:hypothetical protein